LIFHVSREIQYIYLAGEYLVTPTNQGEIFPFDQLKDASSDFHYKNKLGEGGYGAVYKVC
jgi:hypothetical protein